MTLEQPSTLHPAMPTPFGQYRARIRPLLEKRLYQTLDALLGELPANLSILKESQAGGKMIRGTLVCLVSESLGGSLDQALPRAVAVELIHSASLLHDDFVDQDCSRRNQPAAWTLVGARKAVLVGDVIFASAIESMSELSREDGIVVSRAIARVAKGALREPVDPSDLMPYVIPGVAPKQLYDAIIDLKTAALFGVACELGAIAANSTDTIRNHFHEYGRLIGQAFQIADDLGDIGRYRLGDAIAPLKFAALAPSLVCFNTNLTDRIGQSLEGEPLILDDALMHALATAAAAMEQNMESRLRHATDLVAAHSHGASPADVLLHVPRDVIRLFVAP